MGYMDKRPSRMQGLGQGRRLGQGQVFLVFPLPAARRVQRSLGLFRETCLMGPFNDSIDLST